MTVVELFDHSPLQNLSGALNFPAERIVFVGTNRRKLEEQLSVYRAVLARFRPTAHIDLAPVPKYDLSAVVALLCRIAEADKPVIFDVSGGDDYILAAAGVAYEKCREKGLDVRLSHFSVRSGRFAGFDNKNAFSKTRIELTCDEVISLHGGAIVYAEQKKNGTMRWDFSDRGFGADVLTLWQLCRADCRDWNRKSAMMGEWEGLCDARLRDPKTVPSDVAVSYDRLRESGKLYLANALFPHLKVLSAHGLIENLQNTEQALSFSYKSRQIRALLVKAGTVLELVTYLAAKNVKTASGRYLYNDARTGVVLDWDGNIHADNPSFPDTENEIDVLLVRGMIPVFISCKNGSTDENELYKLAAVAEHFGAKFAHKALIATDLQKNYTSLARFNDRAREMGITVIDGVHKMTAGEFSRQIGSLAAR